MQTGLDRLATLGSFTKELSRARVGLLAHPASVDRDLIHIAHKLRELGIRPKIVFGPEHGYGGEAQDMVGVRDARDVYGTPVRSLYGDQFSDLIPDERDLNDLDLLLVDLQDIGSRYYTFVWTAVLALRACAKASIRFVVLDRPNPIGSDPKQIEGRSQNTAYRSFVGLEPTPIRHALTVGEIVAWRAAEERIDRKLVTIVGNRSVTGDARTWDRPFVMPSPNMPTFETALVYPGGCLIEGTNLSEGRGTTRPFELVGAPYLEPNRFAEALNGLKLPGVRFRPTNFLPTFQKHAGKICGGVQVHVVDAEAFRPVLAYVALVALAKAQAPSEFAFRTERYEFVDDKPAFDLLTGNDEARTRIERGEPALDVAHAIADVRPADRELVQLAKGFARDWIV